MWIWRLSVKSRIRVSVLLAVGMTSSLLAANSSRDRESEESVAFVHASVISMVQEGVLPDQTVIVNNGRIRGIGPTESTEVPDGAVVIDATNQFLIPAYCDMHVHLLNEAWSLFRSPRPSFAGYRARSGLVPAVVSGQRCHHRAGALRHDRRPRSS
jgi:imidazolonepropionase-like amidohydrolase